MKILVDQNISFRILPLIQSEFPETLHVKTLGLTDFNDFQIFQYARQHDFVAVLSLDEDFHLIQLEHGVPPKIIWLRTGNCSTAVLSEIILTNSNTIRLFLEDNALECLEIFQ